MSYSMYKKNNNKNPPRIHLGGGVGHSTKSKKRKLKLWSNELIFYHLDLTEQDVPMQPATVFSAST